MRPETHAAIHSLMEAVKAVAADHAELVEERWDTQILLIGIIRDLTKDLGRLDNALERRAVRAMPESRIVLGGTIAERLGGSTLAAWDHEEVSRRLMEALTLDTVTGQVFDEATAQRLRGGFLYAARPNWRASALRDLGVTFDDCVERRKLRRRIRVYTGS